MSNLLYRIMLKHTRSTATLNVIRDILTPTFTNSDIYKQLPTPKQEAFNSVTQYVAICGIDAAGGEYSRTPVCHAMHHALMLNWPLLLRGTFHSGSPPNTDAYKWLTSLVRGSTRNQMYFYQISDGTFWDRIHILRNTPVNQSLWLNLLDYEVITEAQLDKCISIMHSVFALTDRMLE